MRSLELLRDSDLADGDCSVAEIDANGLAVQRIVCAEIALTRVARGAALADDVVVKLDEVIDLLSAAAVELAGDPVQDITHAEVFPPFTKAEARMLPLVARRLSTAEISRRLFISKNTVKTHKKAIYAKLGVSTRAEASRRLRATA
jgi:DNA-binding CsgD family transcriptional regulator